VTMSQLGKFFRARRAEKGLSFHKLAEMAGYKNLNKGSNRIQRLESGGKVTLDMFTTLVSILEVNPDEVRRTLASDYDEWLSWANVPIRPYMVSRLMPCVYQQSQLPDDALSILAAKAHVGARAEGVDQIRCHWQARPTARSDTRHALRAIPRHRRQASDGRFYPRQRLAPDRRTRPLIHGVQRPSASLANIFATGASSHSGSFRYFKFSGLRISIVDQVSS
jgi:transcriptional regulator with XRE-family HTH domain